MFIDNPADLVDDRLGPGLPTVRDGSASTSPGTSSVLRLRPTGMRCGQENRGCLVTVGGSAVGAHLLRLAAAAYPLAARHVPGLRTVLVTGPRIDPTSLSVPDGVDVRGYLPDLSRHLVACDLAFAQGGLSTTMELVAPRAASACEVRCRAADGRRDDRPGRARRGDRGRAGRPLRYRPVERDGAERAAALLGELLSAHPCPGPLPGWQGSGAVGTTASIASSEPNRSQAAHAGREHHQHERPAAQLLSPMTAPADSCCRK